MPHLTQELAQFIYQLRPNDIPTSGTATVRRGISDYMGVMFAGRNEPVVHHALSMVTLSNGSGIAHVLGDRGKASAADAAFVNAVAGHALDYDDTGLDGHPLPVHSTQSVQSLDAQIPARSIGKYQSSPLACKLRRRSRFDQRQCKYLNNIARRRQSSSGRR